MTQSRGLWRNRIRCIIASVFLLVQILTLTAPVAYAQNSPNVTFQVMLPEETGDSTTLTAIVTMYVPEGQQIYGFSTSLHFPFNYFQCTNESIIPGAAFDQECIGGSAERITFQYESAYAPLLAGTYTLFTAQFAIQEQTPEDAYPFQMVTEEAYISVFDEAGAYMGVQEIPRTDMNDSVYVGRRFTMTRTDVTLQVGESLSLTGNKPITDLFNRNPKVAAWQDGTLTALALGSTYLLFTADTGEVFGVTVQVVETATEPKPELWEITSTRYTVSDAYIRKIPSGTTVATLLSGLAPSANIRIYRADGKTELQGSDVIGTGCVVKLIVNNQVKVAKTAVVTGDVNGDGKITAADYVNVKFAVLGKQALGNANQQAGDVNGDGRVTAADYVNIKFHVLGKNPITPR